MGSLCSKESNHSIEGQRVEMGNQPSGSVTNPISVQDVRSSPPRPVSQSVDANRKSSSADSAPDAKPSPPRPVSTGRPSEDKRFTPSTSSQAVGEKKTKLSALLEAEKKKTSGGKSTNSNEVCVYLIIFPIMWFLLET